jgi:hypothetical protein
MIAVRRMLVAAGIAMLSVASGTAHPTPAPLSTPGCQGEGCYDTGEWVAEADLPLFAAPGAAKPVGTITRGTKVTALEGRILTTRRGIGVTIGTAMHLPADPPGRSLIRVPAGTRIRTLYDEGEGIVIAMLPDGRRIGIARDDFREITPFAATDWVRLRLPGGRTGWSSRRDAFLCSSHMDDEPGQCRGIGAQ